MAADPAALVMMHHDALADPRERRADRGADRGDDAARLVPGDGRRARRGKPAGLAPGFRTAVLMQVAAAHAGGLHLDDDLVRARGRVGEVHQFEFLARSPVNTTPRMVFPPSWLAGMLA